ncbi:MAG: hypothetical protein WBX25_20770 [Rhodomicrobium sp.]
MRMRAYKRESSVSYHAPVALDDALPNKPVAGFKFKTSMERRIEALLVESQALGWSYSGFVATLLEVLVVLKQRDRLKVNGFKHPS